MAGNFRFGTSGWAYDHDQVVRQPPAPTERPALALLRRRLYRSQLIPRRPEEVFPFFESAENLAKITPNWLGFQILSAPEPPLERGSRIIYRLRLFGLPLRWHTEIVRTDPPWGFVDVQRRGPYAEWVHTHSFRPLSGGDPGGRSTGALREARAVLMEDRVDYRLPLGLLGLLAAPLVALQLTAIFGFRKRRIEELFSVAKR